MATCKQKRGRARRTRPLSESFVGSVVVALHQALHLLSHLLHLATHLLHLTVHLTDDAVDVVRPRSRSVGIMGWLGLIGGLAMHLGYLLLDPANQLFGLFVQAGRAKVLGGCVNVLDTTLQFRIHCGSIRLMLLLHVLHQLAAFLLESLGLFVMARFA